MACWGAASRVAAAGPPRDSTRPALFEYTGNGPLTLFGRVTGVRYHFPGPRARVLVDARDAPSLEVVRGLEVVKS
jgi:hypothetical protein